MKNNIFTFKGYFLYSLFLDVIAYIWYKNIFFRIEEVGFDVKQHFLLIAISACVFLINYAIAGNYALNPNSALMTTFLTYGIFVIVSWYKYVKSACNWIGRVTLICTVVYLILVFGRRIKSRKNRDKIIRVRMQKGYLGIRNIAAYAGIICIISVFVQSHVIWGINSTEVKATAVYGDEYALAENMDMFLCLQDEEWENLAYDIDRKLSVLQTVVNCEGRYLSFKQKVTLYTEELEDGMLGYYDPESNSIYIDMEHLLYADSENCLETVLHECFHVSQYQYAQMYKSLSEADQNSFFMQDAAVYAREFDNYVKGEDSYRGYYSQKIEEDARNYSKTACEDIFGRIKEYADKQGNNN